MHPSYDLSVILHAAFFGVAAGSFQLSGSTVIDCHDLRSPLP